MNPKKSLSTLALLVAALAFATATAAFAGAPPASPPSQDLEELHVAIFQATPGEEGGPEGAELIERLSPGWEERDHCNDRPFSQCGFFLCGCVDVCEPCGGIASFSCNPNTCVCNVPNCSG